MKRVFSLFVFAFSLGGLQVSTKAQDVVVPAGTLLRCTLDEPDLSSATASVGDPIICHLNSLQEFGHVVFPRGSYLGGHVEADKEPGHFFGKGNLKLSFDRIGLPAGDIPVPSKVIAVRGYRVDRQGDIVGHGHPKRDTVEWLLPPLWPWKVLTLPARGPRPTLKGEEPVTLRLMDDIVVPRTLAAADFFDHHPIDGLQQSNRTRSFEDSQPSGQPVSLNKEKSFIEQGSTFARIKYLPPSVPAMDGQPTASVAVNLQPAPPTESSPATQRHPVRLTLIALRSGEIYTVREYHVEDGSMSYMLSNGIRGSVDGPEVDWRKTSQLNAGSGGSLTSNPYEPR